MADSPFSKRQWRGRAARMAAAPAPAWLAGRGRARAPEATRVGEQGKRLRGSLEGRGDAATCSKFGSRDLGSEISMKKIDKAVRCTFRHVSHHQEHHQPLASDQGCKFMLNLQMVR